MHVNMPHGLHNMGGAAPVVMAFLAKVGTGQTLVETLVVMVDWVMV